MIGNDRPDAVFLDMQMPGPSGLDVVDIGKLGRIKPDGRVHLVPSPDDVLVMVAGGEGGLHAAMLHSWGTCLTVTRPVASA